MDVDLATYLPGDLLVKMDRMSMAWSVEARSPFLDPALVEFAARIPQHLKLNGLFGTKHILKKALAGVVPPATLSGRKKGFGAPIDAWLRGPLRDFSHDVLLGQTTRERGLFNQNAVAVMLYDHSTGHGMAHHKIWSLLMLELWFREFVDRGGNNGSALTSSS
jgi:asparagine synthase (glutamine-hydrolysing)